MTVFELAERMDDRELTLWAAEDYLRAEEQRHAAMQARVAAKVASMTRG